MTIERGLSAPHVDVFVEAVVNRVALGARFCGLFGSAEDQGVRLLAVLAKGLSLERETVVVPDGVERFRSLTPRVPAAAWYEREIHDLFGLVAVGHPRLDPLILPVVPGSARPRPGSRNAYGPIQPDSTPLPTHVHGEGMFTIPYGPVRSGVFESIEYLVETPGEGIPYVRTRVFYKHRGVELRFQGMHASDGVLLAERCEGVASVAHAIAYCGAIERIGGIEIPAAAALTRVVHAELERVANHLDSTLRHTEAAGQAVAFARVSLHKERVQRLRARLCGSRFGRGVVVPGGVTEPLRLGPNDLLAELDTLEHGIEADLRLLMATPSFVDRLRGTGLIDHELALRHAAIGPVGRGSGQYEDVRESRPYDGYALLDDRPLDTRPTGDALARQLVRVEEIAGAFGLIRQAVDQLEHLATDVVCRLPVGDVTGEGLGWAEAPQGELLYLVEIDGGRLVRVKPRSASFHNLGLFHAAFPNDILTDFAFIEASFGVSIAGVAS